MEQNDLKKEIDKCRKELCEELCLLYGKNTSTIKILNRIIRDCEERIAERIKASISLVVYEKYYHAIYQMCKLDYNEIGSEGEVSRNSNGLSVRRGVSRSSDEVLSKIPLKLSL